MKSKKLLLSIAGALAFLALLAYGSHRTHFRWDILWQQMHYVRWSNILLGMLLIYAAYLVRAFRWVVFLRPTKRLPPLYLLGTQVIGFTAVALLGRVADLTRPYLVARRTNLPIALQVAIYTVERMFDACSMATIVGMALLLAPNKATMPHREIAMAGARSALLAAFALIVLAVAVRVAGEQLAKLCQSTFGHKIGTSIAAKIRAFRDGLAVVSSGGALLQAGLLSLVMWAMISGAYLSTVRAFAASPVLASMSLGRAVVLMAASMVGSVFQFPSCPGLRRFLCCSRHFNASTTFPWRLRLPAARASRLSPSSALCRLASCGRASSTSPSARSRRSPSTTQRSSPPGRRRETRTRRGSRRPGSPSSNPISVFCRAEWINSTRRNSLGFSNYLGGADIAGFANAHPGIYGMGDRAGIPAYLYSGPMVQLEGLVMDKTLLNDIRVQRPLPEVLRDYHVRYYVGVNLGQHGNCWHAVEPIEAGPDAPHMQGDFCIPPVAEFQQRGYHVLIFDLQSSSPGAARSR